MTGKACPVEGGEGCQGCGYLGGENSVSVEWLFGKNGRAFCVPIDEI